MNGAQLLLDAGVLLAAPSPSDGGELNSVTVSPGLPGFFAAFVLAVMVVLLAISMTRHTRRIQAQARLQERVEAEERAEAEAHAEAEATAVDQTAGDGLTEDQPTEGQPATELPDAEPDDAPADSAEDVTPPSDEER